MLRGTVAPRAAPNDPPSWLGFQIHTKRLAASGARVVEVVPALRRDGERAVRAVHNSTLLTGEFPASQPAHRQVTGHCKDAKGPLGDKPPATVQSKPLDGTGNEIDTQLEVDYGWGPNTLPL